MAAWQIPPGREGSTLSGMDEYPKGMFGFRLPPGYRLQAGPDVLVLRRADGLMVAAFVAPGVDRGEVEREAAEDHRRVRADARRAPRLLPGGRPLVGATG